MDGLRVLARQELDERLKFRGKNNKLNHVTIEERGDNHEYIMITDTEESIYQQVATCCSAERDANAKVPVTLVVVWRDTSGLVSCSRKTFLDLIELFEIDPYVLRLVGIAAAGLHHEAARYKSCKTYYIGTFCYSLVWSFNPATTRTCGILLPRTNFWITFNADPVQDFGQIMDLYKRHVYTPFFLLFIVHVHLFKTLDKIIDSESHSIRSIEGRTLHSSPGFLQSDLGIDELSDFARALDDVLGHLTDNIRHLALIDSLTDFLEANSSMPDLDGIPIHEHPRYTQDLATFAPALRVLRKQTAAARSGAEYFRERARNQFSVVFALLTHEDARVSISQAEASKELAQAAKEDSSSMKTIAVMTMAFLPATFFAALFAVPSLQWDNSGVVQENFWVYWAFTLPATVVVFAIWISLKRWPPSKILRGL